MSLKFTRSVLLSSEMETAKLASALAHRLAAGDVILLEGGIGAGKTHFARSIILALLPVSEDVPSPTFTLVQTYETEFCEIWHADLYRLIDPDEVVELGLTDAFEFAICMVEWPDRMADLIPSDALTVSLSATETPGERLMVANWSANKWTERLRGLLDE